MSNNNNNPQTQTSSALHNAIMEAGGKDHSPMLAPEETKKWIDAEAEAIHIILTRIDNDIYSTVDACPNAMQMWKVIERLKQCESVNVQDLKKICTGNLVISPHGMSQELKTISYHKLYDILNQHQNEVSEIRAEILAQTANPLPLVAQKQPVHYPQPNLTHYTHSSSTISQAATRNKGKAIANSPPPTYDPEPKVVANDEASLKEKEIEKLMALILMSFKKIYKPTNNNLRTSSNTSNMNADNTPRAGKKTRYDKQTGQYDNQRAVNVVGAMENVGTQVVQQTGIQCFNYKEFGHVARECKKAKRARDSAYHKEKMLLYDEPEDQELEAHYMYMEKIQEVISDATGHFGPLFDTEPLEKVHNTDDNYNVFSNERLHLEQPESVNDTICELLASLIEQMKIEIDGSKQNNKCLESSNKALEEANMFLNNELKRYKESDFGKKVEL
ncbi:retrotransposon protein, putative, unclassified [Tanacetum coccineum]